MYSLFDSQYLWNKMTCSYNSCAKRERVIVCVRSDQHQRLNSVDAAELLSEYDCQCVRCDGCTQRVSTFVWTPLYSAAERHNNRLMH
jgi:hypothetical protein